MASLLQSIRLRPQHWALIVAGVGASAVTRRKSNDESVCSSDLLKSITGSGGLASVIIRLERLLHDLEVLCYRSDADRDRYELINSVLYRVRDILSDLQDFERNDLEKPLPVTNTIAKHVWESSSPVPAGSLSVLSDDSFFSVEEDFGSFSIGKVSATVDPKYSEFFSEALSLAENGKVRCRKLRTEVCGCNSDVDFAAKLHCLRKAFNIIVADKARRHSIIQAGRSVIAELLRRNRKNPEEFYLAYDRFMDFIETPDNYDKIEEELRVRNIAEINLWDVLIDFVLLDSFEDLHKPPSGIVALIRNSFLSSSMRDSTLNNIIWSVIKLKRARLRITDGFVAHFYDISKVVTPTLTLGMLDSSASEIHGLCMDFKETVMSFVVDIFNPAKTCYSTLPQLVHDVNCAFMKRLEELETKFERLDSM